MVFDNVVVSIFICTLSNKILRRLQLNEEVHFNALWINVGKKCVANVSPSGELI